VFAACGRGERPTADLLEYYAAVVLLTTDDVVLTLRTDDEVASWLQSQMDGMRSAQYDHSEVLDSDVTILNVNTALHRAAFSRQRQDGQEINRLTVTYVITDESYRRCISALAVHTS
jgi:hypothetical protein